MSVKAKENEMNPTDTAPETPETDRLDSEMVGRDYNYRWHDYRRLARSLERELSECQSANVYWVEQLRETQRKLGFLSVEDESALEKRPESRLASHTERVEWKECAECGSPSQCTRMKACALAITDGSVAIPAPSPAGLDALAEEIEKWLKHETDAGYVWVNGALLKKVSAALRTRPAQDRDAERYQTCMRLGFPVRNQTVSSKDVMWTIQGKWYGATAELCIDAAMSQQEKDK
jgi:hypothetical protein